MKKSLSATVLLISLLLIGTAVLKAQVPARTVIASAGNDFSNRNFQLSVTAGEIAVRTEIMAANKITEGFQQPADAIAALPLRWLSFTAVLRDGHTQLNWITAQESGNDYFNVQRSEDGIVFSTFLTVHSQGDNSGAQYYNAIDPLPVASNTWYRLWQVDRDGQFSYSTIVVVNQLILKNSWLLVHNPVTETAIIDIRLAVSRQLEMAVYDINGRVQLQKKVASVAGTNVVRWDVHMLPKGIYFLRSDCPSLPVIKLVRH